MAFDLQDAIDLVQPKLSVFGPEGPGAQPFVIEQTTGLKTRIELRGRSLPYAPISFPVMQRVQTTWYQGNPVATQQILGPEFPPLTCEGMWKDRFIQGQVTITNPQTTIETASQLVELFRRLCLSGNEVQVFWATESRIGVLKSFVPTYDRIQDIAWKMEFEFYADGATRAPAKAAASVELKPDALLIALNDLDDKIATMENFTKDVTAQLVTAIDNVRQQIGQLFGIIRAGNTLLALPGQIVGAISAAVASLKAELDDETSRMTDSSAQLLSVTTAASSMLTVEAQRRDVAASMNALQDAALAVESLAQANMDPRPVRVVTVGQGQTLYDISSQYYGTPDFAAYLGAYNGFSSALVPQGTQLLVPPAPPTQSALQAMGPDGGGVVVHGHV